LLIEDWKAQREARSWKVSGPCGRFGMARPDGRIVGPGCSTLRSGAAGVPIWP
jgi:hypothetical protein